MKTSIFLAAAVLSLCLADPVSGEEANPCRAHIVLFVAEGKEVPAGYEPRLRSLSLRTEAFLARWMKRWGSPIERPEIFARNAETIVVSGTLETPSGV